MIKATEDLDVATVLIKQKRPRVAGAAFHAQQAAEKILKAFLTWHDQPFKKNHDLEKIAKACAAIDSELRAAGERVVHISPWAIQSRYPGNWSLPSALTVGEALNEVRELFRQILSRLPEETHP